MKKVLSIITVISIALGMCACGTTVPESENVAVFVENIGDSRVILAKYKLIDDKTDEYINTLDALKVFLRIFDEEFKGYWIEDWYCIDELAVLDDTVDEDTKKLLMQLYNERYFFKTEDILRLDYEEDMKEYDALLFAVRLIGDTYSCVDAPVEYSYSTKEEVYNRAQEKGLIKSANSKNADKPILRKEFYDLICRALNTEYSMGGYAGETRVKHIDYLEKRLYATKKEYDVTTKVSDIENGEFSIPEEMLFKFENEDFTKEITVYTQSGKQVYITNDYGHGENVLLTDIQLCEMAAKIYPESPEKIEVRYYDYDFDLFTKEEYVYNFDVSDIEIVRSGDAPTGGKYVRNKGQWPLQKLSLKEGEVFEKGTYYVICGKEEKYRKEEYNSTEYAVFKANDTANELTDFGVEGSFGVNKFDDVWLIKMKVSKSENGKIIISMTEKSESKLEVIEQ